MSKKWINSNEYISKWFHSGKILHIWEPTFSSNIYYVNAHTFDEYKQIMKKCLDVTIDEEKSKSVNGGFTSMVLKFGDVKNPREEEIGVMWGDIDNMDTMVHEALHAIYWIRDCKKFDYSDEEVWCYLLSFIVKNIVGSHVENKAVHKRRS